MQDAIMRRKQVVKLLIIIFCLYLIVTTIQAIVDLWRAGGKIDKRESALKQLETEQVRLSQEIKEASSPANIEKIARDKLNLARPGEEIIIIPQELLAPPKEASPDATPNWQKWWRLFF